MTIAIGQSIENYRIERLIATGGMGSVYEATHIGLNAPVALKVMDPAYAQRPDFQARFLREAQAAASVPHDNIVKVTHVGHWQGVLYLVMELIAHGSLRARLDHYRQTNTPVSAGFALNLVGQAAEGLDAAHSKGLIHRDIKPENLLLQYTRKPNGSTACTLKIADFGLVQLTQAVGGQQSQIPMLTLDYASPEQLQLQHLDGRSDVFSLGVVAYELLAGQKPFGEATDWPDASARRRHAPQPLSTVRSDLPPVVNNLLMHCLAVDPARRPAAAELAQALATIPAGAVPTPQPAPLPPGVNNDLTKVAPVQDDLTALATHILTQTPSIWPRVRIREGQAPARSYDLTTAGLTLGRDAACSIALADQNVSRQHLALAWDGSQVLVTDLDSSNGSMLGGQRLPSKVATPWTWNTPVRIGGCILQISPPTLPAPGSAAVSNGARTQRWTQRLNQAQTNGSRMAIDVEPGEEALQLTPGQPVTISLLLANLGPQIDHISLSVEGVPAAWIGMPTHPQPLAAAGSTSSDLVLPLTIMVPQQADARAGDHQVKLRATSGVDPSASATVALTWSVQPFFAGELSIAPKRSRSSSGGEHTLTLRNDGNTPVTYSLSGKDDELALSYSFARTSVLIQPGQDEQVKLTPTAKPSNVAVERTHAFSVTAQPKVGGAALNAHGEFVREASIAQHPPPAAPQATARGSLNQQGKTKSRSIGWFPKLLLTIVALFLLRPVVVFVLGEIAHHYAIQKTMDPEPLYTAAIVINELLDPFPNQKPRMDRAMFYVDSRDYSDDDKAIADFYAAIRINKDGPWSTRAYLSIGKLRQNNGETDGAIESFEEVIKIDPSGVLCEDAWSSIRDLDPQYSGPKCYGYGGLR